MTGEDPVCYGQELAMIMIHISVIDIKLLECLALLVVCIQSSH